MKSALRLSLLALVAGLLAFGVVRIWFSPAPPADEIAWMQKEFRLTAAQTAAIEKLQDEYHPVCMEHCKRVMEARKQLASADNVPARESARAELARWETICREATETHLQRVATEMPASQGARFLALVVPKLSRQNHDAPLGLK